MSRYRDSPQPDLQDYYDSGSPTHRLSGNAIPSHSPRTTSNDIPSSPRLGGNSAGGESTTALNTPYTDAPRRQHFGDRRGEFQATNDTWMEKAPAKSKKTRYLVIGGLVLAILIGVGVALGVVLSKKDSSTSTSSSSSVVNQTDANDPSSFEKDSRLKQSFYGIAYTPAGSQYPDCGNSLDDVITDIQLLSQLTTRVRLYGADCNQSALLEAIKQTKVNMSVVIANYPIATDDGAAYERQALVIEDALTTYGTDNIIGVTILLGFINDTKTMLSNMSISLPVGNADAGSYFNDLVLEDVDYGMANVHPWFANVSVDDAAGWTWLFFQDNDVELAESLSNNPSMSIAETGWPTNSTDAGNESNGPSTATEANLQTFLDTFVCQANTNGTEYYFFEAFDEVWKLEEFGGVEGYWGLFYSNKTLKDITIPDCSS
ncbi:glycoside hydrolase superfamily [Lentinula edodes]|uniref:glycoside hydrolase superfamily n=1 Tax=Lentinula edodes TaxID=5353 RepID=UPI001E8D9FED|nr:glycoside hydrolase superfamily [Lentinula edodes]KAH7868430.1 glycoside hydrolase superfamily [Lentinula edodes]